MVTALFVTLFSVSVATRRRTQSRLLHMKLVSLLKSCLHDRKLSHRTTGKPSWHGGRTQVREEEGSAVWSIPPTRQTQSLKTFDPPSPDSLWPSSGTLSTLPLTLTPECLVVCDENRCCRCCLVHYLNHYTIVVCVLLSSCTNISTERKESPNYEVCFDWSNVSGSVAGHELNLCLIANELL